MEGCREEGRERLQTKIHAMKRGTTYIVSALWRRVRSSGDMCGTSCDVCDTFCDVYDTFCDDVRDTCCTSCDMCGTFCDICDASCDGIRDTLCDLCDTCCTRDCDTGDTSDTYVAGSWVAGVCGCGCVCCARGWSLACLARVLSPFLRALHTLMCTPPPHPQINNTMSLAHTHACTHGLKHTAHTHTHTRTHTHAQMHMRTVKHARAHTHIHTYIHTLAMSLPSICSSSTAHISLSHFVLTIHTNRGQTMRGRGGGVYFCPKETGG